MAKRKAAAKRKASKVRKTRAREASDGSPSAGELLNHLRAHFGSEVDTDFSIGAHRGVMITLDVPGSHRTVESEFFPPTDERDHFEVVIPLIPFRLVCAILVITEKTLYARAPYMASSVKIRGRWFFKKRLFYEIDFAEEAELPTRKEILAERDERRRRGEVVRSGRHAVGCRRDHEGRCQSRRPPLSEAERAQNRRRILGNLGK